jgi:hypothetical protein
MNKVTNASSHWNLMTHATSLAVHPALDVVVVLFLAGAGAGAGAAAAAAATALLR